MQRLCPSDILVHCIGLPVALARSTLDRVEVGGPGSRLTRPEVYEIAQRVQQAVAAGEPAVAPPRSPVVPEKT